MSQDPAIQPTSDLETGPATGLSQRGAGFWPESPGALDLGLHGDPRKDRLDGADLTDPTALIRVPRFWELHNEGDRQDAPSGLLFNTRNGGRGTAVELLDPALVRTVESDLLTAHRDFFRGVLKPRLDPRLDRGMSDLVLDKLEANFRAYLASLAERLDPFSEDQRSLRPSSIWTPRSIPSEVFLQKSRITEADLALPLPEHALRGTYDSKARVGDQPSILTHDAVRGERPHRVYTFLARVLNDQGHPLIAFDFNLNAHGDDPTMPNLRGTESAEAISSLMRVYKCIPIGQEEAFLNSSNVGDFAVQFLLSPKSFQFELQQLLEGGARWFSSGDLSFRDRRPYLAKVLEVAVMTAHPDIDPLTLQIDDVRPDPRSGRRDVLLVEANGELTKITLTHSAPPIKDPTYMISFYAEPLSKSRLHRR